MQVLLDTWLVTKLFLRMRCYLFFLHSCAAAVPGQQMVKLVSEVMSYWKRSGHEREA